MIGIMIVAVAGATALMLEVPPAQSPVDDPLIQGPLPSGADIPALHRQVRSETRDENWAPQTEAAARQILLKIPLIGKDGNALRVTCARTICEFAGTIAAPADKAEMQNPQSEYHRAMMGLQDKPFFDAMGKLGLKSEGGLFTSAKGKPDATAFLVYYSRV